MTACPGSCNAAWRATREGEPWPGDPIWCHADTTRIGRQLSELDHLAALHAYHADGYHEQARNPAQTGTAASPSPAADDLDDLETTLTGWEDAYRDWHNRAHPGRPWLTRPDVEVLVAVIPGTIAWLTRHLTGILASPLAADFGLEITQKHRELVAKTRAGTGRRIMKAPCPRCGLRMLVREEADDHVRCGNPACRRILSLVEYNAEADAYRQQIAGSRGVVEPAR